MSPIDVEKHQVMPSDKILDGAMSKATMQFLIPHTSDPANWQQCECRHELFNLLLSYLNGTNQFSSDCYDIDAEKRMDFLLNLFWVSDTKALQAQLDHQLARANIALKS